MRKALLIAAASLVFCAAWVAQIPTSGNVFFGYSWPATPTSATLLTLPSPPPSEVGLIIV